MLFEPGVVEQLSPVHDRAMTNRLDRCDKNEGGEGERTDPFFSRSGFIRRLFTDHPGPTRFKAVAARWASSRRASRDAHAQLDTRMGCHATGRCDAGSIACIAGSISGAALGLEAIPAPWVEGIENREVLLATADELFAKLRQSKPL